MSKIDKQAVQAVADLKAGYTLGHADVEIIQQMALDAVTLLDELEAAEERIAEHPGQKRLICWRMADYTDETADPALAKNWSTAVDVLPIFEGDVNTKLSAAMLQGADGNSPAQSDCCPEQNCIAPAQDGNSPVIPDGWVMVPKEPTPAMLNAAWVSHGIYHASAYRTMLAAAPQRGVGDERQADENLA
ncbi:TPA: hypothetical protein RK087_003002 [Enterobacter hormaechei subsp. xiangfangensis]|nr:hypothetical protein [Enterobacter hormaechei subsp. xiangfangensis]